jgi:hypothetical protein
VLDLFAGWPGLKAFFAALSLDNFRLLASDPLYLLSYVKSVEIAAFSTLILLVIGYPIAYAIARAPRRWQAVLVLLVVLPFWTSLLIRIYSWMNILQREGPLNNVLAALHLRNAGETRRIADRGRRGSRLSALEDFLAGDAAVVVLGHAGRRAPVLHPDRRRVRHSRSAGRLAIADDRPDHLDGIFQQPGLAGRVRRRDRAGLPAGHADRDLSASGNAGG